MRTFVFALVLTLASSLLPETVFAQSNYSFVRTGTGSLQQSAATFTVLWGGPGGDELYIDGLYAGTIGIPAGVGGAPSSGASLVGSNTLSYTYSGDDETDSEALIGQSGLTVSPDRQPIVNCASNGQFGAQFNMPITMGADFFPRLSQTIQEDFVLEQAASSTATAAEIEVSFSTGALYGPGNFGAESYGADIRVDGIVWCGSSPAVIITGSTVDGFLVSTLNEWGVFEDTYFPSIVTGSGMVGGFSGVKFGAYDGAEISYDLFVDTPMWIYDHAGDQPFTSAAQVLNGWDFSLTATGITTP